MGVFRVRASGFLCAPAGEIQYRRKPDDAVHRPAFARFGLLVAASGYLVGTGQYAVGPWFAVGLAAVLSYLLVCNVPMFALKFKHYGFRGNEVRYIFAVCALLSLAIWHIVAIPFIIVAYVAVSLAVRAACFRKS